MLRPARDADADAVADVLIASRRAFLPYAPLAHPEPDVRAWVRHVLIPSGGVTVWEAAGAAGAVIAVIAVLATSRDERGAWIDHLYVAPGHEGHGIGAALLAHAHATLPRPIRLHTFQANVGARRFYERHGYRLAALTDGADNEEKVPDALYVLDDAR